MSDYEDIKTIQYIVNTSPNKETALQRFYSTVGFSIPLEVAKRELNEALRKRFEEQPEIKKEVARLAALIKPKIFGGKS